MDFSFDLNLWKRLGISVLSGSFGLGNISLLYVI